MINLNSQMLQNYSKKTTLDRLLSGISPSACHSVQ
jgi:hypothetical protein